MCILYDKYSSKKTRTTINNKTSFFQLQQLTTTAKEDETKIHSYTQNINLEVKSVTRH